MSTLVIPNNFAPATVALSSLVDANFAAIATWGNGNIDHTNVSASIGIYPSQIISDVNAGSNTFSSAFGYVFASPLNVGGSPQLTITSPASATQPTLAVNMGASQSKAGLLVNGAASITGNLLQVDLTSGGAHALQLTPVGGLQVGASVTAFLGAGDISASKSTTTGIVWIGGSSNAVEIDFNIKNNLAVSYVTTLAANPDIFAGTYHSTSDATLKTNVAPISEALETLMKLKPSTFDWIASGKTEAGFLAQDVAEAFPLVTSADSRGIMSLAYSGLTALHIASTQDIVAKLKAAGVAGF